MCIITGPNVYGFHRTHFNWPTWVAWEEKCSTTFVILLAFKTHCWFNMETGDYPQEERTKFGQRPDSKVNFKKVSCLVLASNRNSQSKSGYIWLFSLKIWRLLHIFFSKNLCTVHTGFFFPGPSRAKILPPKKNSGHKVFVAFYIAGKQGAPSPHRENKSCVGGLLSKPSNLSDAK